MKEKDHEKQHIKIACPDCGREEFNLEFCSTAYDLQAICKNCDYCFISVEVDKHFLLEIEKLSIMNELEKIKG